ncbi:MAG TPA: bifunctional folylpolyglutamate synthase/dihydrofolate synthase [Nitrospiraceae bacterium]|nr:bifunctional folylpolyglutamate synthase/dihydrofolate synthase [Nitrospiraceae bacterium]
MSQHMDKPYNDHHRKSAYQDSVNYLYGLQKHGIKLGLENPRRLMDVLGNPQKNFSSIHIAGTNGKGSTSAMLAAILMECGFKVGLYTSPHLVSFTERIKINGLPISESDVVDLTGYIRKLMSERAPDLLPTFFEFVTAMAFYYFSVNKIDWAIVEVGMGGRLDATNVIIPQVSVITNSDYDHKEFLGDTIREIATEEAGIIKPAIPVVTAAAQADSIETIKAIAERQGSPVYFYGKDFSGSITSLDSMHIEFDYYGFKNYSGLILPLTGRHQLYNATVAIMACELLMQKGLPIHEKNIRMGLKTLRCEGRLEWASKEPDIILDGAHNPPAADALAESIKEIFPEKSIILIVGIMKDKDIDGILRPLSSISDKIILTRPKGERAATTERLKKSLKGYAGDIKTTDTVPEALKLAQTLYKEGSLIVVTGSFYTTGEVKEVLGQSGLSSQLSRLRE